MKLRSVLALISGGTAYILIVLISLIKGLKLQEVLFRGLLALVVFAAAGWLFITVIGLLNSTAKEKQTANKKNGENDSRTDIDGEEMEEGITEAELTENDDFSPLTPPILTTEDEENAQGER